MHTERCGMGGRTVYSRRRRYSPRVITEASQRPRLTGHVTANSDRGARENMVRMMSQTHTHTFNGPLSGTTRVSRYQKGNTNLYFTEARDSE